MHLWRWIATLATSLAMAGCGDSGSAPAPAHRGTAGNVSTELKHYAASDLPPVEEPLPPLDNGRVLLSPPIGWRLLPRDPKYLVRLVKGEEANSLPRITVATETAPDSFSDVTEDAAADFAAAMEQRSAAIPGRKLLEPERPIVIGDIVWSRHVRQLHSRSGSRVAATQSLTTVRAGRLYSIELSVDSPGESAAEIAKAVLAHRDSAYALAANWKFAGEAAEILPDPAPEDATGALSSPADAARKDHPPTEPSAEKNPD